MNAGDDVSQGQVWETVILGTMVVLLRRSPTYAADAWVAACLNPFPGHGPCTLVTLPNPAWRRVA